MQKKGKFPDILKYADIMPDFEKGDPTGESHYRLRSTLAKIFDIRINHQVNWRRFGGFIVNFEHISHLYSSVSTVNFEHVIAGWVRIT